jgi:hypothetical protein
LGNVGIRKRDQDEWVWVWSASKHTEFINKMRAMLPLNDDFIRFYITCYGFVVAPIPRRFWAAYGIHESEQLTTLSQSAPRAAHSMRERMRNQMITDDTGKHYYVVIGHVDDLMNGDIPIPDQNDERTSGINEDKRGS